MHKMHPDVRSSAFEMYEFQHHCGIMIQKKN